MKRGLFAPSVPEAARALPPVVLDRLRGRARRELLQRTFAGMFVYPAGTLVVSWATGLLGDYPAVSIVITAALAAIVVVRLFLYRSALRGASALGLAARLHLMLGIVSAGVFSAAIGLAYVARGGDARVTAGYVALAAIAGGIVSVASTHRRLAAVWVLSSLLPGMAAFVIRRAPETVVLLVVYVLYLAVLRSMVTKAHAAWWEAQVAAARLDEQATELVRLSRHAGVAENATNVLHDVGNALNAVKTSTARLAEAGALHPAADLRLLVAWLERKRQDVSAFAAGDGEKLARFIGELASSAEEHARLGVAEVERLATALAHIEGSIARQQSLAREVNGGERCRVAELVDTAISLSRARRAEIQVELASRVGETLEVLTDRAGVQQILVNLLENAWDSVAAQGTHGISVRARVEDEQMIAIEVSDDGQGIAAEVADRVFERGFTTKPHGHGFGLHGSAALARALGGTLTFTSAGVGRGAAFCLRLPLAPVRAA